MQGTTTALILVFIIFWFCSYGANKDLNSYFVVRINPVLSKVLFFKKLKYVLLQSIICQILLYSVTIIILFLYFITKHIVSYEQLIHISNITIKLYIPFYVIMFIPDAVIYSIRHKNK